MLACGSTPPPPQPAAAPQSAPKPVAKKKVAPKPPPEPAKPKTTKPQLPDFETLMRANLPKGFEATAKNFKDKYFDQAIKSLDGQRDLSRKGQLPHDHKMLMYASYGFANAMQNQPDEAKRNYRRILPMWGNWRKQSKALKALEKDEAAGQKRVDLAIDCVGEALFYLGEVRRDQADKVALVAYDGDSDPKNMHRYLKSKVKPWIQRRGVKVRRAISEYKKVLAIQPKPPARFVSAATARIAAMHALMFEELREIKPPSDWKSEGKSDLTAPGKKEPLEWKAIQEEFQTKHKALADPLKAAATEAYKECLNASQQHGVGKDDLSLKSCNDWLDANP
jgi:hypothetical protein